MARNRLIYLLILLASVIFSAAYHSNLATVLLVTVLLYPVAALIYTAISLIFIKAGFAESRSVNEKNTAFEVGLILRNRFIFGYAPLELICTLPDSDTGLFSEKRIFTAISPLGRCRLAVNAMHRYRGSYTAEIRRIAVYDPLKLIRLSKKISSRMNMIFLPRRIMLGSINAEGENDTNITPIPMRRGDKDDFSHVREYILGDIMQLVHWKLTAKQDSLMIKQYDETTDRRAVILCDFSGDSSPAMALRRSDGIVETAVAFCMATTISEINSTVDICAADRSLVFQINNQGEFEQFYNAMTVLPARIESLDLSTMLSGYSQTDVSALFLVTADLSASLIEQLDMIARNSTKPVLLAFINCTGISRELESSARESAFLFLNIKGENADALLAAIEEAQQ